MYQLIFLWQQILKFDCCLIKLYPNWLFSLICAWSNNLVIPECHVNTLIEKEKICFQFIQAVCSLNYCTEHVSTLLQSMKLGVGEKFSRVRTVTELQGPAEEASLPTNNPHQLNEVYSFKDHDCNQPFSNSAKHLCLSLKRLLNDHKPYGTFQQWHVQ